MIDSDIGLLACKSHRDKEVSDSLGTIPQFRQTTNRSRRQKKTASKYSVGELLYAVHFVYADGP